MKTAEIRESYLSYFETKSHTRVPSSSLIPAGDPTLLFANSGMVQFKDCFLGSDKRDYVRATTAQKCLRISGKHNDLENVGRTARHHTFFEMMGNFSFGDYFKSEAIGYAWEYVTKTLGLPREKLWVTIFENDDQAEELWKKNTDVLDGRIIRKGEADNFWAMGETGPCGPCSEIFYYLGSGPQSAADFLKDDGIYVEIWNLVFMQFSRDLSGTLTPLPRPSIDTGMGLERVAGVVQGKKANYDSDLLRGLIKRCEELSGISYLGQDYSMRDTLQDKQYAYDVAMRVAADHCRAAAFLVAEGVVPSSDGRGYVLRRLIRRACRHGRVLGFTEPFLYKLSSEVVSLMGVAYPELSKNSERITNAVCREEEKFLSTLESGMSVLTKSVEGLKRANSLLFPGEVAFQLHDTYGFPLDLTDDVVAQWGMKVDQDRFSLEMDAQRERSRSSRAKETDLILRRTVKSLPTEFVGYKQTEIESEVIGLFDGEGDRSAATTGASVALVTKVTPFYPESGGQIGDTGSITTSSAVLDVLDTQRIDGQTIVHVCQVLEGEVSSGQRVRLKVDEVRRNRISSYHSATHLVHLALRRVLGQSATQAGSRVGDRSLRFDYNNPQSLSAAQIEEIEGLANQLVRENAETAIAEMDIEQAKSLGAMALFSEKYGNKVRVVTIGSSVELCGGTHTSRAGDIGQIFIQADSSIASGVRRLEAIVGSDVVKHQRDRFSRLASLTELLKTNEVELGNRVEKLIQAERELDKKLSQLLSKEDAGYGAKLLEQAKTREDGIKVVTGQLDGRAPNQLREIADNIKSKTDKALIALASEYDGKAIFLVSLTKSITDRYHAGDLMKQVSEVAGVKGGGKPDFAQAGGGDPKKIGAALKFISDILS